jgi:hypothetical protein
MTANRVTLLLGAALVAAPLSWAEAGAFKTFGAWEVSCTNGRNCELRFYDPDKKAGANAFVTRDIGPGTPAYLALGLPGETFGETAKDLKITVSVEGAGEMSFGPDKLSYDANSAAWRLNADLAKDELAETLKTGKEIKVTARAGNETVKATIPLNGMAASLLFLDDVQNRVGHTDALVSQGAKPPSPLPPVTDIRTFADIPEKIRPLFSDESASCGGVDESMLANLGGFTRRYSENQALYVIPCGAPGAYNVPFTVYTQIEDAIEQLQFPAMSPDGPSVEPYAYNLDYDEKTDTVTSFFKGRGLGDCGNFFKWKFTDGDFGRRIILLKETSKDDCDGKYGDGPESWPQAWPIAVPKTKSKP